MGNAGVSYNLVFPRGSRDTYETQTARLTSPLLDPEIHAGTSVAATFSPNAEAALDELVINEFHFTSLISYLTSQSRIRKALQGAIEDHLAEGNLKRQPRIGSPLWEDVKISNILFPQLQIMTPADIAEAKAQLADTLTEKQIEDLLADGDTVDTRTKYVIALDAHWADEHSRLAEFRDDRLVKFRIE